MEKVKITFEVGEMRSRHSGARSQGNYMMSIRKIEIEDAEGYTDYIEELYVEEIAKATQLAFDLVKEAYIREMRNGYAGNLRITKGGR